MKPDIVTAIILCSASLCHAAESQIAWGEPVNGISVGIIFSNATVRAHEPVEVTVLVRNDSSEVLFLPTYPPTWYFDIMATPGHGIGVPATTHGRFNHGSQSPTSTRGNEGL